MADSFPRVVVSQFVWGQVYRIVEVRLAVFMLEKRTGVDAMRKDCWEDVREFAKTVDRSITDFLAWTLCMDRAYGEKLPHGR